MPDDDRDRPCPVGGRAGCRSYRRHRDQRGLHAAAGDDQREPGPAVRRGVLERWDVEDSAWTCLQLISELATNAVIHARTEFTVEVGRDGHVLRVCVRDDSPAPPGVRRYSAESTTGRGRMVESMSADWGVQPLGFGKTIWFEIDLSRRGTAHSWDDETEIDLEALLDSFADQDAHAAGADRGNGPAAVDSRAA